MELQQVRVLAAVAAARSFTGGARAVFLTQSAASMAVKSLEEELGVRLLDRSGRGVRPTEAGRTLLELAEPLVREWDGAPDRLREALSGEPGGRLTVAAGGAVLNHWLPDVVRRFRRKHPRVELVLRSESRDESLAGLREGRVDVALRSAVGVDGSFETRPLFVSPRVLVAPRGTGLPRRPRVAHLAEHAFVVPGRGSASRRVLEGLLGDAGHELRVALEGGGWDLLKRYVRAGLGLAVVPDLVLTPADRRALEVRRMGPELGEDPIVVITARGRQRSRAAAAFVEACLDAAGVRSRGARGSGG